VSNYQSKFYLEIRGGFIYIKRVEEVQSRVGFSKNELCNFLISGREHIVDFLTQHNIECSFEGIYRKMH
jgi:hypothetical protein